MIDIVVSQKSSYELVLNWCVQSAEPMALAHKIAYRLEAHMYTICVGVSVFRVLYISAYICLAGRRKTVSSCARRCLWRASITHIVHTIHNFFDLMLRLIGAAWYMRQLLIPLRDFGLSLNKYNYQICFNWLYLAIYRITLWWSGSAWNIKMMMRSLSKSSV